jgi:uncharacterized membrane protein
MLGFLFGAACLFGLIKVLRAGRGYGWHGGYGGYGRSCGRGHGRWGGYDDDDGPWSYGGRRRGPRVFLRMLFERLDATPGQEKVIQAALEQLFAHRSEVREEMKQIKNDIASAMRGPVVDDAALDEAYHRQDVLLAKMRVGVTHAIKTVHEALDDRQRKIVADLLERGPFGSGRPRWGGGGGPYRTANA